MLLARAFAEELSKHQDFLSFRKEIPFETFSLDRNSLDQMKNRFPALADGELAVLLVTLDFVILKRKQILLLRYWMTKRLGT